MFSKYNIFVLFFCLSVILQAQNEENKIKLSLNYFTGTIIPEFGLLDSIDEKPLQTFEINLITRTKGKSYWEDIYNYPEYGLAFFYTDLGEKDVLGEVMGVDYFFKINLVESAKTKFYTRVGFGINYTTKKYNAIENPLNISVGSNINAHFNLRFGINQNLFKNTTLNFGGSFDHISNAATQFPNLGVNYVSFYGGLIQNFGSTYQKTVNEKPNHESKWQKSLTTYFGARHLSLPKEQYYFVPSLSADFTHQTFILFHLGVGLDAFYDGSIEPALALKNIPFETNNAFLVGFHFNQTLVYNRFSFTLQEGFYLNKAKKVEEKIMYNRVIFNYDLTSHLSLKLGLRTYLQDLRYLEPGIAFRW